MLVTSCKACNGVMLAPDELAPESMVRCPHCQQVALLREALEVRSQRAMPLEVVTSPPGAFPSIAAGPSAPASPASAYPPVKPAAKPDSPPSANPPHSPTQSPAPPSNNPAPSAYPPSSPAPPSSTTASAYPPASPALSSSPAASASPPSSPAPNANPPAAFPAAQPTGGLPPAGQGNYQPPPGAPPQAPAVPSSQGPPTPPQNAASAEEQYAVANSPDDAMGGSPFALSGDNQEPSSQSDRAQARRSNKSSSGGIGMLLKPILGGFFGLCLTQVLLWWLPFVPDRINRDPADLAKHIPDSFSWIAPESIRSKSKRHDDSDSTEQTDQTDRPNNPRQRNGRGRQRN